MNRNSIKLRSLTSAFVALLLIAFCSVSAQTLTPKYNTYINANCNGYYVYLPQGYSSSSSTKYPVIVFIHGVNEKGSGSTSVLGDVLGFGLPKLIKSGGFPTSFTSGGTTQRFIVMIPQFRNWPSSADVAAVIDYTNSNYRTNASKVYLTGLSMGGGVCWTFGANATYNKKIAAIVPVCGAASPSTTKAYAIADGTVKAWGTHNRYDGTVSSSYTKNWIAYMKARNSSNAAKATLFDASGHNAWSKTYSPSFKENNMNVYEWMLQYSRGASTATTNAIPVANAGSDKTITLPTNYATLSGSGTDANGSISKYSWTKVSGPSTYTFSSTSTASPKVSALVAGTYVFRLTVTDNAGATDTDDVTVIVKAAVAATTTTTTTTATKVEAESYTSMEGVEKQTTTDAGGGQNVTAVDNTDWMIYRITPSTSGTYTFTFRLATVYSGGQLQVINGNHVVLATVTVPNTGGGQTWKSVTASVKLSAGAQDLIIYSNATPRWNLNYFTFARATTTNTLVATDAVMEETATVSGLTVAPNAFTDKFVLKVNNTNTGAMKVQLIDVSGIIRKEFQVSKNVAGTTQTYLSAGSLPAGNYFVKVQIGSWSQSTQVVKL